jgi:hypothetical protein
MTNSQPSPSKGHIEEAILYSYDGTVSAPIDGIITEINFSQSLEASAFLGSIRVQDNIGRLENFPLRGEERLQLTIVANDDINNKRKFDLQVYRIDNITMNEANDGVNYYMHFLSKISFEASKRRVIESLRVNGLYPSASLAAQRIFSKYFRRISRESDFTLPFGGARFSIQNSERTFIVQPSEGILRGIIPRYTPTEAMYFLSTRAFISERGFTSCSFRFFETFDDFYFVSDEYLIKYAVTQNEVLKLYYAPQISKDGREVEQQINSIERIDYPVRVDSAMDMYSGGYSNSVLEIDFMRRAFRQRYFNYLEDTSTRPFLDMQGLPRTTEANIHTERYMRDTFTEENAKRFHVYRDYAQPGDIPGPLAADQHIAEIVSRRTAYQHHLNATSINVAMKGRLDIRPGNVVNLEVVGLSADSERTRKNPQLSGNYLVYSAEHSFKLSQGEDIFTNLRLSKYDWSA